MVGVCGERSSCAGKSLFLSHPHCSTWAMFGDGSSSPFPPHLLSMWTLPLPARSGVRGRDGGSRACRGESSFGESYGGHPGPLLLLPSRLGLPGIAFLLPLQSPRLPHPTSHAQLQAPDGRTPGCLEGQRSGPAATVLPGGAPPPSGSNLRGGAAWGNLYPLWLGVWWGRAQW